MAFYRIRDGNMSQNNPDHAINGLRVLTKVESYVQGESQQRRYGLARARGHWRFRYGKALADAGQMNQGLYEMARGILADRNDVDYKLSFMLLAALGGSKKATAIQWRLKRVKDSLLGGRSDRAHDQEHIG